ncbi:MAG: indolepyruvate ferredoxin oxidoreductase family protein [Proteobacteria bacterium]|nr:indolepyruvate ferredoxin oxidoreductase family protein [Pseudomonadota bacterium]
MRLRQIEGLEERYGSGTDTFYLTGLQALAKLLLLQSESDARAGLNTAGFVSGYRGSPLAGLDQELWRAKPFLEPARIHFQPGLNEDLAATSIWGTQQVNLFPGGRYDGVFGLWYGKGPGVDRSGDVFKHANNAGTARFGGVLVVPGDDHICKSSTLPQQSEYSFMAARIPVLNPSDLQDVLELGLKGYALSRYSGCWIALKLTEEHADASQTVRIPDFPQIVLPEFELPGGGVHIRWPDAPMDQEIRLHNHKIPAALAFARANGLNRLIIDSPKPRLGIVSTGKAYLDVRQALDELGIDRRRASELGIRLFKVGMSWPLESVQIGEFAAGLEEVLVVEEKRGIIEDQLKEQLYNRSGATRPRILGKLDEHRHPFLSAVEEFTPASVATAIARRLLRLGPDEGIARRLPRLEREARALQAAADAPSRLPHFCSGCPHNTSTRVPDDSIALGGIGCHYMAIWMDDRDTKTFTQMGGEGAAWIGQAPFTDTPHVFQNLGDGTYAHSGLLAVRAAVAAGVNMTYKILYNDAVAMTGGQPVEGGMTVDRIARQLAAEGVGRVVVVTDETRGYPRKNLPEGVIVHHRRELDRVQRELREHPGVSALIYDQTCAAELRRRRRRGEAEDPDRWVAINPLVCEGCGDCNAVSNCLSVIPLETEFGRKRAINQSACNKDFSCIDGFCPSFVTLEGVKPRKPSPGLDSMPELAPPIRVENSPCNVLLAGVGGTGVGTVASILGLAAHLEGRRVMALDQTGLAQKFGAVVSHVRIGASAANPRCAQIPAGKVDLLLGADLVVASGQDVLARLNADRTRVVVNTHEEMPAAFIHNPDYEFVESTMLASLAKATRSSDPVVVDATGLATALLGDTIAANLFLLGVAFQRGLLPVSEAAIIRAIELNRVAVEQNVHAFTWGRHAVVDPAEVRRRTGPIGNPEPMSSNLDEIIERRATFLTSYQNAALARRYREWVDRIRRAERGIRRDGTGLTETVARQYFKLLAYKDEYEVARLFARTGFLADTRDKFDGSARLTFHLSPPLIAGTDPATGRPRKYAVGAWILPLFGLLARLKWLRGTPLDVFGYSRERRAERRLIVEYETVLSRIVAELDESRLDLAVELAGLPERIRGYGPVKAASIERAKVLENGLLRAWAAHTPIPGDHPHSEAA